jgi:transposase
VRLNISRSKNSETFYVIKSFRDETGKNTSKIVEKLGTRIELEERLGSEVDLVKWAKERARELTETEQAQTRQIMVPYNPNAQIDKDIRKVFGGGYLFLQAICSQLGLFEIAGEIAGRSNFDYDLGTILSRLVYGRILYPASKKATAEFSKTLIEKPTFETHQVYRALEVLATESDFIQAELYKNSKRAIDRKDKILYYDCTNFFFEIECEDEFRCYGHSKQHQPLPLVQMGLFMDAGGMPLAFSMNPGNTNEQITMTPLEQKILDDFKLSKFIVCTDGGLSSITNKKFNSQGERQFVTTQSIKKLKGYLRRWALDVSGWHVHGTDKTFDLSKLDELLKSEDTDENTRKAIFNKTFYKERMTNDIPSGDKEPFEQRLIVTFSFKYRSYQQKIRQGQIERAKVAIDTNSGSLSKKNQNDYRRFVKKTAITKDGEVADKEAFSIDDGVIAKEALYDGFYGLVTGLDADDIEGILKINAERWQIEECFRIMKSEFKARPVYLSRKDRIRAHFLTCFIALLVYRILEVKLDGKYTCEQIIDTLRCFDFKEIRGEGYEPLYMRTDLTDSLHDAFGFRTDFEIVTSKKMKEIFRQTKKG